MKKKIKYSLFSILLIFFVAIYNIIPQRNEIHSQLWGINQLHFFNFKRKLKARLYPSLDKRFSFKAVDSFSPEPFVSTIGGFYDYPITVSLSCEKKEAKIYYTLDGRTPTKRSRRYKNPIHINRTVVLRFRSFEPDFLPSKTVTHTYLINEKSESPVLSLVTDPVNLWNKYSGIYENPKKRGRKWERHGQIEYMQNKNVSPLNFPVKIRVHGNWSRSKPKKSFRIIYFTADIENADKFNTIFTYQTPEIERTVILRAGGSNVLYRLRDELFHTLYSEVGGHISAFEPCVLFLNGEYWGIYNIRERIDEEYLKRHFGQGEYDLIPNQGFAGPKAGDKEHWESSFNFLITHALSTNKNFEKARRLFDIENLTNYWLLNIYAANMDWPHNGIFSFRNRNDNHSQWRWICWDADATFDKAGQGLENNTLAWAIRSSLRHDLRYNKHKGMKDAEPKLKSTLIIRSLLENEDYKKYFINRFCDLINTSLLPEKVEAHLNWIIGFSINDLPYDWRRWNISKDGYWENVQDMRNFIYKRPEIILKFFQKEFELGKILTIKLFNDPPGAGKIQINTVDPDTNPWSGRYFAGSTITLTARPAKGYRFESWTDPSLEKTAKIKVKLDRMLKIGAIYKKIIE